MIKEYKKDNDFTVFQCFNKQDVSCQLGEKCKESFNKYKVVRTKGEVICSYAKLIQLQLNQNQHNLPNLSRKIN